MLIPISSTHSISKVIANFFLAQSFAKPEYIFEKLSKNKELSYQKRGLTSTKTINFNTDYLNISNDNINGFMFEEFDDSGSTINVLKIENINSKMAVIGFENKKYLNWTSFKNRFLKDQKVLANFFEQYTEAIALTYVDEFNWKSDYKIDIESVFNKDADIFNKRFLKAYNGTLVSVIQSQSEKDVLFCEEKTEILFNNELKKIIVNHTCAFKFNDIKVFSELNSSFFEYYFDKAHQTNKDFLKSIFSENTIQIIGLN